MKFGRSGYRIHAFAMVSKSKGSGVNGTADRGFTRGRRGAVGRMREGMCLGGPSAGF